MTNTTESATLCGLNRKDFQATIQGKKTDLYILRNRKGYEVAITNYGGAICAIMVPDKDGNVANVIQGHDNIQDVVKFCYIKNSNTSLNASRTHSEILRTQTYATRDLI